MDHEVQLLWQANAFKYWKIDYICREPMSLRLLYFDAAYWKGILSHIVCHRANQIVLDRMNLHVFGNPAKVSTKIVSRLDMY